jgi:hypothetical protein
MSEERRQYNNQMFDTLNAISGDIGQIKGALEALSGPQGRITSLEEDLKTLDRRGWIQTAVIIPVVTALHLTARKLGL